MQWNYCGLSADLAFCKSELRRLAYRRCQAKCR